MLKPKIYATHSHSDVWERLDRLQRSSDTWIYRGQANSSWHLSSGLERVAAQAGVSPAQRVRREPGLIRKFKRVFHQYSAREPHPEDYLEWLSLMQHHGAPTRLVDWTYSGFVALFFALERAEGAAALWALNLTRLNAALKDKHPPAWALVEVSGRMRTAADFRNVFAQVPPQPLVAAVTPYATNLRLTVQQGLFLCPGDIRVSFEENLTALTGRTPPAIVLQKIRLPARRAVRQAILRRLHRMNMSRATLYPGLDGFAASLREWFSFDDKTLPADIEWTDAAPRRRLTRA